MVYKRVTGWISVHPQPPPPPPPPPPVQGATYILRLKFALRNIGYSERECEWQLQHVRERLNTRSLARSLFREEHRLKVIQDDPFNMLHSLYTIYSGAQAPFICQCPETFSCVQEQIILVVPHQLTSFGLSYKQKSFTLARLFMLQSENPATRVLFMGNKCLGSS